MLCLNQDLAVADVVALLASNLRSGFALPLSVKAHQEYQQVQQIVTNMQLAATDGGGSEIFCVLGRYVYCFLKIL